MDAFAQLLDRLVLASARNAKVKLMVDYFAATPDPDRGLALAALMGDLSFASVKPAMLRALIAERMDAVLFAYSYDYVGDLAETISLVWQPKEEMRPNDRDLSLADAVERLSSASRADGPRVLEALLDRMDAPARFAIIKLVTGGLRVGVSAGLAKQALEIGRASCRERV